MVIIFVGIEVAASFLVVVVVMEVVVVVVEYTSDAHCDSGNRGNGGGNCCAK